MTGRKFEQIGIFINPTRPEVDEIARSLITWLEKQNRMVHYFDKYSLNYDWPAEISEYSKLDVAVVLGGDGTFLNVARALALSNVPLIGVNLGNLGFLTEIDFSDFARRMEMVFDGEYTFQKRYFLKVNAYEKGKKRSFIAINDAVISRTTHARLIGVDISWCDKHVESFWGDGVIFSSATGSTGYSLSAGGPIIFPEMRTILVTPIAPHTLTCRSLIMPSNAVLQYRSKDHQNDIMLTIDGIAGYRLTPETVVEVLAPSCFFNVLTFKDINFFSILKEKLCGFT